MEIHPIKLYTGGVSGTYINLNYIYICIKSVIFFVVGTPATFFHDCVGFAVEFTTEVITTHVVIIRATLVFVMYRSAGSVLVG